MNRISLSITILTLLLSLNCSAQKFKVTKSHVKFFSEATLEDIAAENEKAISLFDYPSRKIAFSIPIKEFQFDKKLMQEHFNENYLESEKYPKATFSGLIEGFDIDTNGEQKVTAKGTMNMHGVTKEINVEGTLQKNDDGLILKAVFPIKLKDYKVKIPRLLLQNIAEEVEVTLDFQYKETEG